MLDSGAYETLVETDGAYAATLGAVRSGGLEILYTQINVDELAAAGELNLRRRKLLAMVSVGRFVYTAVFALGYDRRSDGIDLRGGRLDSARLAANPDVDLSSTR